MLLYLVRHGIAINRKDPDCPPEPERYLTPKGIEKTRAAAAGLRAIGIEPDTVLTSPFLRAVQTAEIFCAALGIPIGKIRRTDALKYGSLPVHLFEELARLKADEVMCFGHAPHLDEVIAYAVRAPGAFTALKKAGAACLEVESLSPPKGMLLWLHAAKTFRQLGA
ncbi:MAG TPA: histidine phosphatase family protein [Candidatus Acidoferrales bacterium]|jgi:phosphohistidine phosphatase|nr:histidine phosphatase family protein [Candidatus Acidoferrales bacterium]